MALQSGQDVAEAQGPNASLEFGRATAMQAGQGALKNDAPAAYAAAQPPDPQGQPPQGAPAMLPGAGQAAAPQSPAPALSQPAPITPQDAAQEGGRVFPPVRTAPTPGWREGLATFARHPDAGPFLHHVFGAIDDKRPPAD